jgi:hypothetical protein
MRFRTDSMRRLRARRLSHRMSTCGMVRTEYDHSTVYGLHGWNGDAVLSECDAVHGTRTEPADATAAPAHTIDGALHGVY